ncbi:MAG: peptide-methionine (S)-S-oxide reductase MsrA [Chitinophagales bacterium]|nr:peptide-methionine (S)-S-oxide reductase MsrA [Chitinophagales bacterium]
MNEIITLGGGCFWCTEAVFQRLNGVVSVQPGYMGGQTENPTYEEVCTGMTGHAEVSRIEFDPEVISLEEILEVFFTTHDPTTLNRQGNDIGTQYRSVIFYKDTHQKEIAEKAIAVLEQAQVFDRSIVTDVQPASTFYVAENYHHNYYNNNKSQPYCTFVVSKKVDKLKKVFKDKLKEE